MERSKQIFEIIFGVGIVICLWYLLALWLNKPIVPMPHSAIMEFAHLFLNTLLKHFLISGYRVLLSLLLAVVVAVPVGLFLGQEEWADRLIAPVMYVLYPIPKIVFLPIIFILLGLGDISKIFLVGMIIFFQILVTARDASKAIPVQNLMSMKSLGANKFQIYRHLVFPSVLPKLFTSLRISLGTAIAVLFLAETYASTEGLGYFIMSSMSRVEYTSMYAGILGMSVLGLLLYFTIDILERFFCIWQKY